MRGFCLLALTTTTLMAGCALHPPTPGTATGHLDLVHLTCNSTIQPEQQVELDLIDRLMSAHQNHAALAQLESKPLATEDHWLRYGQLLASTGQLDQAQQVFQTLVSQCNTGRAHHGLGMVLMKRNEINAALKHLKIARERDPADSDVRNDYGYALLLIGDYQQAAFELRTAMELGDGKGPVRENLAIAYLLTDNSMGMQWLIKNYGLTAKEKGYAEKLAAQFKKATIRSEQ